jgi:hypothetical protein
MGYRYRGLANWKENKGVRILLSGIAISLYLRLDFIVLFQRLLYLQVYLIHNFLPLVLPPL